MWGVAQLVMRHVEKRYVQSPSISVRRFTGLTAAFSPALSFCCAEDVSLYAVTREHLRASAMS